MVSDCYCFDVCTQEALIFSLQQFPSKVYGEGSPWYRYLKSVYANISLPFDLTTLEFLYHHKYNAASVFSSCNTHRYVKLNRPWWQNLQPRKRRLIQPLGERCDDDYCKQWKGHTSLHKSWTYSIELFALNLSDTIGTRWHRIRGRRNVDDFVSNHDRVEVMRTSVISEGMNGEAMWFAKAIGSGIFLNVGNTFTIETKESAFGLKTFYPFWTLKDPRYFRRLGGPPNNTLVSDWMKLKNIDTEVYSKYEWVSIHAFRKNWSLAQARSFLYGNATHNGVGRVVMFLDDNVNQMFRSVGGGDIFPYMAHDLGFDSVQVRTSDLHGGSSGTFEIAYMKDLMSNTCTNTERSKHWNDSCSQKASACPHAILEYKHKPCVCHQTFNSLNCI
jgi:hypothetical protein